MWVSVVMEFYMICIDVFMEVNNVMGLVFVKKLVKMDEFLSNFLVFINVLV